jgi:NAD-dependent deacetylase sirtuin 1
LSHKFIQLIESQGHLLRNYTQNIDTLEQVAGIEKVLQCHGSFATATCLVCKYKVEADAIREDIMNQVGL